MPSSRSPSINSAGILLDRLRRIWTLIFGNLAPIALDVIQQIKRGRLVRPDGQPAGGFVAQLGHARFPDRLADSRSAGRSPARSCRRRSAAGPWPSGRSASLPALDLKPSESTREIAGWVRSSFSAAREKLVSVATVRKTRRGCSSIKRLLYYLRILLICQIRSVSLDNVSSELSWRHFKMADRVYIFDTTSPRRGAIAWLQHDRAGKTPDGGQAGGTRRGYSGSRISRSPRRAIRKRWTPWRANSRG